MINGLKKVLFTLIGLANVLCIALMLLVGYSDRLSPEAHPTLGWVGITFPAFVLVNLLFVPLWALLSKRGLLIPVVGFLLAFPPIRIYMPLHLPGEPPEGSLRIISYNVAGYGGNYKYDHAFDSVFSYIIAHKPDIVCLQEDMTSKWLDTQERFAEVFAYNDTTCLTRKGAPRNCMGIHTRFPILRKERLAYSSPTNGSVAYYLQIGKDTVIVINNHLETSHLSSKERNRYQKMLKGDMQRDTVRTETFFLKDKLLASMRIRAHQVEVVQQYVEAHRQYPIIVCGDFNDTPISYTRHVMAKGLTDCFVETGNGLGLSFNRKGFNFRIDHMMCSSHLTPYACEIDNKMDVSDHYPLLCWLKMRENP